MAEKEGLEALIDRTVTVPTIPEVLAKLDRILAAPDVTMPEIAEAISGDPALASKVLRIANSAVYGLKAQVRSLDLAVALLGMRVMRSIVLTATIFQAFAGATKGTTLQLMEFWRHSFRTAVAGRMIQQRFLGEVGSTEDEAYVAGLLHDLGILVLLDGLGRTYVDLLHGAAADDVPLAEREYEELGFDHADVGSVLSGRWNLPRAVVSAIAGHHEPRLETPAPRLAALTHVADYVAKTRGVPKGFTGGEESFHPEALEMLGRSAGDLSQMVFFFESEDQGLEMPFGEE